MYLAAYVLEPLRKAMGEPIKIGSGFRCQQLNKAVGGVANSQHLTGQAADLCIDGDIQKGRKWFEYIRKNASGLSISARICPSTSSSGRKTRRRAHAGYTCHSCIPTSERIANK